MQHKRDFEATRRARVGGQRSRNTNSATAFLLLTYLCLSFVPFLPLLWGMPVFDPLALVALELFLWLAFYAVCSRPAFLHWLLLPAFLALPFDLYLYRFYGQGIGLTHLGILSETSPRETAEFLGAKAWLLLPTLSAMAFWWYAALRAAQKTTFRFSGQLRCIAFAVVTVAVVAWFAGPPAWMEQNVELADTRPFGLAASIHNFWREQQALSRALDASETFSFGATADGKSRVIVVVIGESSRADRWSLNGYNRKTNPLLEKEKNLTSFTDVVAAASATRLSLPVILTRRRAIDTYRTGFAEKSFVAAFREAGFRTWWLSNQVPVGEFDTVASIFAHEAEEIQFLNPGDYSRIAPMDGVLLSPLQEALAAPGRKKLIVLHTLGSHWNYSLRHPDGFNRWQPSLSGVVMPDYADPALKIEIANSYDNSILYTDWFLSRVIALLKESGQPGAMLYISDHGENLQDGACDFALHGHNTVYDYHIPMLTWLSEAYLAVYPAHARAVKRHRAAKLSVENVFYSLIDLGDVSYKGAKPSMSVVSASLTEHKRYVDSYGWADYDHASSRGTCREIIDRGAPLPRSDAPL